MLQRATNRTDPGSWDLVTGHIQERESVEEAGLRELKEETNLTGRVIDVANPVLIDETDVRWVDFAVLVEVEDASQFKMDQNESQSYKWIRANDPLIESSLGAKTSLKSLGL